MSSLPTQPFQVVDFAGGLTENFIGGGSSRYMAADNFWVTVDRKLEERYGSQLYAPGSQPGGTSPLSALFTHDYEAFLMATQGGNVYVLNPTWTSILGPTGNNPITPGMVSSGEWSHHTLITTDALASRPTKLYQATPYQATFTVPYPTPAPTTFGFMAVTAGLPPLVGSQNINNNALLAQCLTLANALKTNMLLHFADYGSLMNTNLHYAYDLPDATTLNAAATAVDQPSLFVLITALIKAFTNHVQDVILNYASATYHWSPTGSQMPLNYYLSSITTPTTLVLAAGILDDLKTKFYMHQMAPTTHDGYTNYGTLNRYIVTAPHIGTITTGPLLTQNITQSLALANNLRYTYNAHIVDPTYHIVGDATDQVTYPIATDLDSLYILITLIKNQYQVHYFDSLWSHNMCTVSGSSGSQSLTGITLNSTGAAYNPTTGVTIWDRAAFFWPKSSYPVTTTASGTGTATASVNAGVTGQTSQIDFTSAKYHIATNTNGAAESLGQGSSAQYSAYPPTAAALPSWILLLSNMVTAINTHDSNPTVHLNSAMHQCTANVPTIASYAYALHYFYQYMRYDGVIFNVVSAPVLVGPIQTEVITPTYQSANAAGLLTSYAATSMTVSNIPTLINGAQDNYDVSNVQIKIFRTINAGATYYNAGLILNGTTSFTDTLPDVANSALPSIIPLNQQNVIYTSGGVVNFDPAPVAKYITIMQNTAYYGAIVDTGQTFLNRIRQSIQNNIDSSPGSFFLDLPDVITGLSNTRNILVAFCKNSTYQVTGQFNQLGQGQMNYQSISDTIGCVSSASIVRTDVGIFFAGTDGFYYTDGYQLIKLSSEINLTYAALVSNQNQQRAIYGCYDRYNRRVWWSTQPNPADWSATQSYIFHVNFGVNATGVFTTASNYENYRPSSMIFWHGQQLRGDARGYLFLHSLMNKTDPVVNIATAPSTWATAVIPYNYSSCAVDFGTTFQRKWITRIGVQGKNVGNVGLNISSISDNGRVPPMNLSPIIFKQNVMWGQPNYIWGAPNSAQPITWGATSQMDMWRRFPATQLRADYKQIVMTPAYVGVYRYPDWPAGCGCQITQNGNGTASVRIITPTGFTAISWPLDVVGYYFSQQSDAFTGKYLITSLTTTTVTNDTFVVSDPSGSLASSYVAWIIRGLMKQQRLSLTSYTIHFTLLGKAQQAYHGSQDAGENAVGTSFNH